MYSPMPHDLTFYDDQFDFEKNGVCPYQWEISVPQKNCITWGVVLSYLRSADFSVPGKFEERLNRVTEKNAFDPENVRSSILDFNPFFNIHKCFFDETLQNVKESFRKVLSQNRPRSAPKTVAYDMQLICTQLKSNILIVDVSKKSLHLVTPLDGCSADSGVVTLFCREFLSKVGKKPVMMKRFTYSLSKDLCWDLRIDALQIILESSAIMGIAENELQQLPKKKEQKVNVLIALLKKNLNHVISELYDSSYILYKLEDAGFVTDPRILDEEGFSAFYYAVQTNDNNLVYILYTYAANNCHETEATFRDPDPGIVSNLSRLDEILKGDCTRSNNFEEGDRAEEALATYQDLLRFNEFLTQVSQGIHDIRKKPEGSSLEVAAKQKERILLILDAYDSLFSVGQLESKQISEEELIGNYTKHKTYYDNLDLTVARLFFDSIFLLKSFLKSPRECLYSELEFSFLLSAMANKFFTGDTSRGIKVKDLGLDSDSNHLSIIPILERFNLREKVKLFCSILNEKQGLVEEDIVHCVPECEMTERLSYFQDLKDEFLISRLEHYTKASLETAPESGKLKFVIQRTLQVIGEAISNDEENPSSIRHLLRKCLPENTLDVLKRARNTLLHLKSFQFPLKFEIEEDDCLFNSMKSEIRAVREAFQEVFDIQRLRLKEFLISQGLESMQKFQQNKIIDIHPLVKPMKNLGEELRKCQAELKSTLDQIGAEGNLVVPNIHEFCRRIMGFVTENVKKEILDEIPLKVSARVDANEKLLEDLDGGIVLDLDRFDTLFLREEDLNNIKKEYEKYLKHECESERDQEIRRSSLLHKIKNSLNPFHMLDMAFEKSKISDTQLEVLCENVPLSDEAKSTLNSLLENSHRSSGDNLTNLLNRIKHLYRISIDERHDIRFLWERVKSSKARQYLVYKIVQRYLREPSFQATLEMLLCDCSALLKDDEDFTYFWKKDSHLFSGIDLRAVLVHGDPLVESIGDVLDPKDLPSELVKKMLQLFEDRKCIEALSDMCHKEKQFAKISDNSPE